ncbi:MULTISPECIES: ABC transporter substrate-binding protein [unclassified Mesobacillus]|jgi:iron complex transport system substrate-binding protein|uniref:ABC transporter substrate-binding protein n=1 Tax=unclassified Mesobacillus TaxID=2675270 RepID=UPI002040F6BF|nr:MULTISPECIES: ABC transporter substrate-binding protein [unclassified Mesobacillus]MCM3122876.1 ABC transporter substrate-binding protein [Mesobacillus sp. MER 33]MCM3233641.1 ABC transporter substrate-binding protein [Mesobacillus sp. MER 48]
MKKLNAFLFALLLTIGALAGCGNVEQSNAEKTNKTETVQQEEAKFPVSIKDGTGQEVTIESKPEKIVSLIPSNTEIAYGLGLDDQIIGVSDFDNFPEEVAEKEKIGGMEFNVEKIISLKPDLVLAHASGAHTSGAGLQQLKDAGITVLVVNDATTFNAVYESISMIGTASGEQEKADTLIADMKKKIEEIKTQAKEIKEEDRKLVFVEVSPTPEIYAAGKNTFIDEMLQIINADNTVKEEGWPKLDPEAIIKSNPDVIITTHGYYTNEPVKNVISRKGWDKITAVKENRVVDVHSDKVTRTGPRLTEGVEELAKAVYPDVFK